MIPFRQIPWQLFGQNRESCLMTKWWPSYAGQIHPLDVLRTILIAVAFTSSVTSRNFDLFHMKSKWNQFAPVSEKSKPGIIPAHFHQTIWAVNLSAVANNCFNLFGLLSIFGVSVCVSSLR